MPRAFTLTLAIALLAALALLVPWGRGEPAEAQPPVIEAREIRGQPVRVNGRELRLYVHVFPAEGQRGRKPGSSYDKCTDGDQSTTVPRFASANPNGLVFNVNRDSIPIDKDAATTAIQQSFQAWDAAGDTGQYFTVNATGGAARPAADGNNTVGWAYIVPRNVLAATWTWTDASGAIVEADIFYNLHQPWGVFTTCNAQDRYEVGNVGTHEVGHAVGLDHLSDTAGHATMYPSAPRGEVKKRTLTAGDKSGYTAAGGY